MQVLSEEFPVISTHMGFEWVISSDFVLSSYLGAITQQAYWPNMARISKLASFLDAFLLQHHYRSDRAKTRTILYNLFAKVNNRETRENVHWIDMD